MTTRRAIIGYDGLDPIDVDDFSGDWHLLNIETIAHTCPSWNAIFSGKERDGVYDFGKVPESYNRGSMLAQESNDRWEYDELNNGSYVWERVDGIEVVSVPIVLPTFSTLSYPPGNNITWPTSVEEIEASMNQLKEYTLRYDDVITVFPLPDKMNHRVSDSQDYTAADRRRHMQMLSEIHDELIESFDEWVVLSDHGVPGHKEWPIDDLWVPSHHATGVVSSNVVGVDGQTNITIYDKIMELFQ